MSDPVRVEADYLMETAFDLHEAAEAIGGGQSSARPRMAPARVLEGRAP